MHHAPAQNFFGNWVWWLASALAYHVARWLRVLALPEAFRTCTPHPERCHVNFLFRPTLRVWDRGATYRLHGLCEQVLPAVADVLSHQVFPRRAEVVFRPSPN